MLERLGGTAHISVLIAEKQIDTTIASIIRREGESYITHMFPIYYEYNSTWC